ncbi:MAG: carboxypeptidase regulatory-like domain-containing protein [Defluviitaleaceae bacterium]|nr:carboxypeptidase regulatory-like domain-containing protein [Defluviitaleaceae bacterium]
MIKLNNFFSIKFARKYFLAGFFILLMIPVFNVTSYACTAYPFPFEVTQSDGTEITILLRGDSRFSWAEDEAGYVIAFDDTGENWHYAGIENGRIVPSGLTVGSDEGVVALYARLMPQDLLPLLEQVERFDHTLLAPPVNSENENELFPMAVPAMATNQRILLLLIEFNNVQMSRTDLHHHTSYFSTAPGAVSVVNFWRDMSRGQNVFIPAPTTNTISSGFSRTVALPANTWPAEHVTWARNGVSVTISPSVHQGVVRVRFNMNHPIPTWANVPRNDEHVAAMVSLALRAIHEQPSATFDFRLSQDDLHVYAIVAGNEASGGRGAGGGQVWGHAWAFHPWAIGGTAAHGLRRYATHGEMSGNTQMGIGLPAHELGHTLGLPDLYAYNQSGIPPSAGLGAFCLMADGSWGALTGELEGHFPVGLSAWPKYQLGYVTPVSIPATGAWQGNLYSLASNSAGFRVLKVTHPTDPQQYFLVENRQTTSGWDRGMQRWMPYQGGILVYHVDMSMRDHHSPNDNPHRKLVGLVEADGSNFLDTGSHPTYTGHDAFFRVGGNFHFGPATNPNSNFYALRSVGYLQETGIRNVPTGINISTLSFRSDTMSVRVGTPSAVGNTITGTLRASVDANGIGGATVSRLNLETGERVDTTTNADGSYFFTHVPNGSYVFIFHMAGRNPRVSRRIDVNNNSHIVHETLFQTGNRRLLVVTIDGLNPFPANIQVRLGNLGLTHVGGIVWTISGTGDNSITGGVGNLAAASQGLTFSPASVQITDANYGASRLGFVKFTAQIAPTVVNISAGPNQLNFTSFVGRTQSSSQTVIVTNMSEATVIMDELPYDSNWIFTPEDNWRTPFARFERRRFELSYIPGLAPGTYESIFTISASSTGGTAPVGTGTSEIRARLSVNIPTGSIAGVVREEEDGDVVFGANVTLVNMSTGERRDITTNSFGVYWFTQLTNGTYRLVVTGAGRTAIISDPISLTTHGREVNITDFIVGTERQRVALVRLENLPNPPPPDITVRMGETELMPLMDSPGWWHGFFDSDGGTDMVIPHSPGFSFTPPLTNVSFEQNLAIAFFTAFEGLPRFGDVTGRDLIDFEDVLLLRRYIARHLKHINGNIWVDNNGTMSLFIRDVADVYYDGNINLADIIWLRRFIAGHNVYLGPQPSVLGITISDDAPAVQVSAVDTCGKAGDFVDVQIYLSENPGIAQIGLNVDFDSALLTAVSTSPGAFLITLDSPYLPTPPGEQPMWFFFESEETINTSETGMLVTIRFEINPNAFAGTTEINLDVFAASMLDEYPHVKYHDVHTVNGTVTIEGDDGTVRVTAEDVAAGVPGTYVDVALNLENNPGLIGLQLDVDYDRDILTAVSVTPGTLIPLPMQPAFPLSAEQPLSLTFEASDFDNIYETGVLATIRFRVEPGAVLSSATEIAVEGIIAMSGESDTDTCFSMLEIVTGNGQISSASPRDMLAYLIAKAQGLLDDTAVSVNGSNIPTDKLWARQSHHDDLKKAILDAVAVLEAYDT